MSAREGPDGDDIGRTGVRRLCRLPVPGPADYRAGGMSAGSAAGRVTMGRRGVGGLSASRTFPPRPVNFFSEICAERRACTRNERSAAASGWGRQRCSAAWSQGLEGVASGTVRRGRRPIGAFWRGRVSSRNPRPVSSPTRPPKAQTVQHIRSQHPAPRLLRKRPIIGQGSSRLGEAVPASPDAVPPSLSLGTLLRVRVRQPGCGTLDSSALGTPV